FRTDRPREISTVLTQEDMPEYDMYRLHVDYLTMTRYDDTFMNVKVLFENEDLVNTMGEVVSKAGKTQVRIAETEKYPHVTFFFSGGREIPFAGEERILVSSPKVATYDLQPEMSAYEVTDKVIKHINEKLPDFVCLNFANADMVGHTGDFKAAMQAAHAVDQCMSRLVPTLLKHDYKIIVIADHGNADYMINADGTPNTAHTKNPVPCIFVSNEAKNQIIKNGKLADIAPTLLHLMQIDVPAEMDGDNLLPS
ncbi:MAG: alkaline phosphatase family protein, partial [Saprospiraceae bacterium]|nr:alkaline phosphatase family protein [Saprospiraceae bacterium]